MGYDLTGKSGNEFRFNVFSFSPVLLAAIEYGWEPKGVYPDEIDRRHYKLDYVRVGEGDVKVYLTNGYQEVGSDDAQNLKVALQKAIDDDYSFDMRHENDEKMKGILNAFLGIEDEDATIEFPNNNKERFQEQTKRFIEFLDKADGFIIG
jgi:hypothetical protein